MQIWLDTVNLDVVADAAEAGVLSGVTTNPSILSKTQQVPKTLSSLLELQQGPVAVQVTSDDAENIVMEARAIFAFSNRTVIKIPLNRQGLIAMRHLREEEIPFLATGIFHPAQALLAANQGATYISPYFSHIAEIADAYESLKTMVSILQNSSTKILVASVKNLTDLIQCAVLGAEGVTIKEELYHTLVSNHPLLERASQKFQSDWQTTHGERSVKNLLQKHSHTLTQGSIAMSELR